MINLITIDDNMITLDLKNSPFFDREFVRILLEESNYESLFCELSKISQKIMSRVVLFTEVYQENKKFLFLIKPIKKEKGIWNKLRRLGFYDQIGSISLETPFRKGEIIKITIERELHYKIRKGLEKK